MASRFVPLLKTIADSMNWIWGNYNTISASIFTFSSPPSLSRIALFTFIFMFLGRIPSLST